MERETLRAHRGRQCDGTPAVRRRKIGPAAARLRHPGRPDPFRRAIALHLCVGALLLLAGCVEGSVSTALRSEPAQGKDRDAFHRDEEACTFDARLDGGTAQIAAVDAALKGAADEAAPHDRVQRAVDDSYVRCMSARGDTVGYAAAQENASAPAATPAHDGPAASSMEGSGWQPLTLSDHRADGGRHDQNDAIWRREILEQGRQTDFQGHPGSLTVASAEFSDGAWSYVLSAALQAGICDGGPNDVASTRDYASCPARLAKLDDGRLVSIEPVGTICIEFLDWDSTPNDPDWKSPEQWGTRARYDGASGSIRLMTMQGGRPDPDCAQTVAIH